jgi:hypothetical protein
MLSVLLVAGCQATDPFSAENDPRSDWWGLAFTEPAYMKVWVEDSTVLDIKNRTFFKAGGRTATGGEPEDGTESARGWGTVSGSGNRCRSSQTHLRPLAVHIRTEYLQGFHRNPRISQAIDGGLNAPTLP